MRSGASSSSLAASPGLVPARRPPASHSDARGGGAHTSQPPGAPQPGQPLKAPALLTVLQIWTYLPVLTEGRQILKAEQLCLLGDPELQQFHAGCCQEGVTVRWVLAGGQPVAGWNCELRMAVWLSFWSCCHRVLTSVLPACPACALVCRCRAAS